jgi:hypothetical protein
MRARAGKTNMIDIEELKADLSGIISQEDIRVRDLRGVTSRRRDYLWRRTREAQAAIRAIRDALLDVPCYR